MGTHGDARGGNAAATSTGDAASAFVVEGWLLGVTYEDVEKRTWFRLWVKHDDGSVRSYLDRDFDPYFFVLPDEGVDAHRLADAARGLRVGGDGRGALTPRETRVETRIWNREERDVVRVLLHHPGHTPPLRQAARQLDGVDKVLEADVPFAHRYLMDKGLRPMDRVRFTVRPEDAWHGEPRAVDPEAVTGEGAAQGNAAEGAARATRSDARDAAFGAAGDAASHVAEDAAPPVVRDSPPLKVLAVDIEVATRGSMPDATRDEVLAISYALAPGGDVGVLALTDSEDLREAERDLFDRFVSLIADVDPDVIVTFNGDGFDWPYLETRAEKLGVRLAIGRAPMGDDATGTPPEPTLRQAGMTKVVEIPGRLSVDLFKVAARDLPAVKVKTLSLVAEAVGVPPRPKEAVISPDRTRAYWDDPEGREKLLLYAKEDARETLGIADALLPLQMEYARLLRHPLDDVSRMGRGRMVDVFLMAESVPEKRLAPNKGGQAAEEYEGGFVLEPESGLHEDVVALDFGAMYPTLMMAYNVSPETYAGTFRDEDNGGVERVGQVDGVERVGQVDGVERVEQGAEERTVRSEDSARAGAPDADAESDVAPSAPSALSALPAPPAPRAPEARDVWVAPEVGHAFLKSPPGFFPRILRRLVDERRAVKALMRDAAGVERDLLDVRQQALKVLTNAFYGYMGWAQARWYSLEAAEATTAWGRHVIRSVRERAEAKAIRVIYGDTDSLFVTDTPEVGAFVDEVNRDLPLELDVQARFEVIFFTGMKKRYAGLTREGEIVARGLEVRRGDWCALAKRVQQQVLETVLRHRDPDAAAKHVRETVTALRGGRVPVEDLTIHKTLTQRPSEYKVRPAHVAAVERADAAHRGYRPPVGAKIAYVILVPPQKGADTLAERAKLVQYLDEGDQVDAEYYVDKQVIPAAHRILEHFGYTEDELKGAPKQRSLFEF